MDRTDAPSTAEVGGIRSPNGDKFTENKEPNAIVTSLQSTTADKPPARIEAIFNMIFPAFVRPKYFNPSITTASLELPVEEAGRKLDPVTASSSAILEIRLSHYIHDFLR